MTFTVEEPAVGSRRADKVRATHDLLPRSCGLALGSAGENSEHFLFAHDDVIFAIQLDLGARVLAKQDAVAFLHIERTNLALFVDLAFARGDNFALLRLLLSTIRDNDSAAGGFAFFNATDQDAVVQWGEFRSHFQTPFVKL